MYYNQTELKEVSPEALIFIQRNYFEKYPNKSKEDFSEDFKLFESIPAFKASENIHQVNTNYKDREHLLDNEDNYILGDSLKPEVHWIMRSLTQYYLTKAFAAMKVDLEDPNIKVNALGKGTPGRIAKMWVGNDPDDITELGSGRWNKEPAISYFPNEEGKNAEVVTKEVDVISCCSHHFLPFSTFDGGKAIISYKPDKYVLGISKLQRFVNWAAKRFWLQEDLTKYIGDTIKRIAATDDVYVKMEGLVHGCEKFRGASAKNGSLTTEYKSGIFKK